MVSQSGLRSDVAVKVLRGDVGFRDDAVRRLRDEGRLLATLNHPNILRVLDFANLDGRTALVTEYVEGEDLTSCILATPPLSLRALMHIVGAVADALNVAWSSPTETGEPLKLVHRDIKPSNIRISRHGEVRILDFGIAWSDDAQRQAQTSHGSAVGSLLYMAPERFGRGIVGSPTDVYALGCTLFEGLACEPLHVDAVAIEMVTRAASAVEHDHFVRERLATLGELPPEALDLLTQMLAHNPAARPAAATVAMQCEHLAESMDGVSLKQWCRRHDWIEPGDVDSGWVEQVFVDGTTSSQKLPKPVDLSLAQQTTQPASKSRDTTSETFMFGIDEPAPDTLQLEPEDVEAAKAELAAEEAALAVSAAPPPPAHSRAPWVLAFVAVGAAAWLGGRAMMAPDPVEAPPVVIDAPPTEPSTEPLAVEPATQAPEPPLPVPEPPVETGTEAPVHAPPVRVPIKTVVHAATPPPEDPATEAPPLPPPSPPPPASAPVAPGTVFVQDQAAIPVRLRSGGRVFQPGDVPPGHYDYDVNFGGGVWKTQGAFDVASGGVVTIRCNKMKFTCGVD